MKILWKICRGEDVELYIFFFFFLNHDFREEKRPKRANMMWLQRLSVNRERRRKRWRIFLAEGGNESSSDPSIKIYRSLIRRLFSTHFPISPSWSVFHVRELLALTKSQYEISASERVSKCISFFVALIAVIYDKLVIIFYRWMFFFYLISRIYDKKKLLRKIWKNCLEWTCVTRLYLQLFR